MRPPRQPAVVVAGALLLTGAVLTGCSADNPVAPTGPSSLVIEDLVVGTGVAAANGDTLTVEFVGWLFDPTQPDGKGVVFDATNGNSFPFVLGAGTVIEGWERGLVGMRVGGERRLTIPPDLGFGGVANGVIPPNSTLVFEVELLSVE